VLPLLLRRNFAANLGSPLVYFANPFKLIH
jgi:hypothetical protein